MPTPVCVTPGCDHPAPDARICWDCTHTLADDLTDAPDLDNELTITLTKQDHITDGGRRTAEIPLPIRLDASETAWVLRATLAMWVRVTAPKTGTPAIAGETATLARWLLNHLDTIRQDDDAGTIVDDIGRITDRARRTIDKPPLRHYLGPCECGPDHRGRPVELYALPGAVEVTCTGCNLTFNVADRREWLLKLADDQLLTAVECSRALPGLLDAPLTAAMVRGFAHRGRLTPRPPHPADPNGHPRYKVGDVRDVMAQIQTRKEMTA